MRHVPWSRRAAELISRRPTRRRPRGTVVPRLEEFEPRVTPTGNIVLNNALLVNTHDTAMPIPDTGEQVFVEADWSTVGLPSNASYRVSYSIDGVTLSTNYFGYGGGGSGTQFWYWYLGGWFAAPGTHTVTVTVDPDQSVAETSYADNTRTFTFTPISAPDLPHKFITPLAGTPFQSWGFVNYVDVDPRSPNLADYAGGNYTYDGHTGHDMSPANFGVMDAGLPDLAAADGTVVTVQDGNYDRNTVANNVPANYVIVDHGNGWQTIYYHFRMNSILVHVGDHVVAGQVLGFAGSSGYSTGVHLHFEVQHNGDVVEEEYDPSTFWLNPLPYQGSLSSVVESAVTSAHTTLINDLNAEERPVAANVFRQVSGQELTVWMQAYTRNNDAVVFKFYKPDGSHYSALDFSFTATQSRGGYWYYYNTLPSNLDLGTWHVGVEINGTEMARDAFQVTAAGAGAARLAQGGTYVANGRTTPLDFGTVSQGSSPPQRTFTVTNLGSASLSLSNLVLPSGFSLVGSFPSSVGVGASATFTLQMATGTSGINAGIVQFTTSDPNAPTYAFAVKGTVSGGNPGAVHGQVFRDLAGDGIENASDAGLSGWTVSLINPSNGNLLATTSTGFNGYYAFLNLPIGTYRVRETAPPGWSQTTPNPSDFTVGLADVLVSPFGVGQFPATHFTVSAPATATAGTAVSFTVTALDQFNTAVVGYSGTVHFTSSDPQSGLPANTTLSNGTGTFSATLKTAGNQTLTATDTANGTLTGSSGMIAVSPAATTHFAVSAPSASTAGNAILVTVRALDAFGNQTPAYAGTVAFSSSDAAASLPANSTLSNGVSTFAATLVTVGNQTVTATDTASSTITGTSGTVAVGPAAATHFSISAPAGATAGSAFSITLTALDAYNNTATGYGGTVHFTSSDGQANLPANSTLSSGTGSFSVTLKTAGSQTVTAADTANGALIGTSSPITVSPDAATQFSVSAPASATAGNAFTFTVTALDAFNNTATGYGGTTHFTSSDLQALLPPLSGLSSGTGSFSATLKTAGVQAITATDTASSSITGASGPIIVSPAAATHFAVSASPASITAGGSVTVSVLAQDAFNNLATGYTGTVHLTSSDGQATLPADSTLTNGSGSFDVTLRTAGGQTVTATDTGGAITGTSSTVGVTAAAVSRFGFSVPGTALTGTAFSFSVTAVDAFGNAVTGYGGTVHFTSSDGQASLPPNINLNNGAGIFNATLNTSGSQTLTATDTANGTVTGTSNPITVRGLIVTNFTPTPTGFSVTFSRPFVNSSASPINIYDAASAGYGPPDVTLVASDRTVVKGSLLINGTNTGFTFVKTNVVPGGTTAALLATGTYLLTLVSGPTAFKDTNGAALDGNGDGINGDNYTTSFTVTAPAGVVVTVPDFARGPDSTNAVNVPNNSTNGIPIALSNGAGVTDGTFVLQYNANLLTITGGTVNPALTGATVSVTTSGTGASAQATIVFHSPTALAGGAVRLGGLVATVPAGAPYKGKELLHFSSLSLNGGAIAALGDDGVHVVAFLGDTTGDGLYTSADSVLIGRVAAAADSGFAAYPVADPVVLADLNGDGRVTALDGGLLNNFLAGASAPQLPPYPGAPGNNPAGPDPALSVPADLRVGPGGTVTVPVNIDDPHPEGSRGLTQAILALRYDPAVFSVSAADIHLGSVSASGSGWALQAVVDPATGQIAITLFSATPISSSLGGSLVTIDFHVRPGAQPGASAINLVSAVNLNGRVVRTGLYDDVGPLTLHPAPTDAATDPGVDGLVVLTPAQPGTSTTQRLVDRVFGDLAGPLLAASRNEGLGQAAAGVGALSHAVQGNRTALLADRIGAAPDWLQGTNPTFLGLTGRVRYTRLASQAARPAGGELVESDLTALDLYFAQTEERTVGGRSS
jgi:hypothetical protein